MKYPICNRIDRHPYACKTSSIVLYFIHLGTILGPQCPINVQWLREITEDSPVRLTVMSCMHQDLSQYVIRPFK